MCRRQQHQCTLAAHSVNDCVCSILCCQQVVWLHTEWPTYQNTPLWCCPATSLSVSVSVQCFTHIVTHLVWPHQQDKSTREALSLADQSMKKPILVFLNLSNLFLKALRLVAPTICWSSMFHILTTLLEIRPRKY